MKTFKQYLTESAEQKIRDAFSGIQGLQFGKQYPITVEHNGIKRNFLAHQEKAGGAKLGTIHLLHVARGRLINNEEPTMIANHYKLDGKNRLSPVGSPTYARESHLTAWKDAGFQ